MHASIWGAGHLPYGPPLDQRPDEAFSLCYEWPPLEEELEILGYPLVDLTLRATTPVAFLSAKLCDVWPDGTSALVSRTVLNLTHRNSHTDPEPLQLGESYSVQVELDATSWRWETGHRIRLDLAGADWPSTWAPPERGGLSIDPARSALSLPVLEGPSPVTGKPALAPARHASAKREAPEAVWRLEHDLAQERKRVVIAQDSTSDLEVGGRLREELSGHVEVSGCDPGDASAEGRATYTVEWPEATVGADARLSVHSDPGTFHVVLELDLTEGDERRWTRRWERAYPRALA
jgi:hypothetical protein